VKNDLEGDALPGVFVDSRPYRRHATLRDEPFDAILSPDELTRSQNGFDVVLPGHYPDHFCNKGADTNWRLYADRLSFFPQCDRCDTSS
jgi:hypothetical protein